MPKKQSGTECGKMEAPEELMVCIREFWSENEWENAANIAQLESGFDAFAKLDTSDGGRLCGKVIEQRDGVNVTGELSVGYFQINSCNFPGWEWQRFYNARHNAGTAHMLWEQAGKRWSPWYFSAKRLGLL